jgi:branched-chain amino acid transport system substrate-binding protein
MHMRRLIATAAVALAIAGCEKKPAQPESKPSTVAPEAGKTPAKPPEASKAAEPAPAPADPAEGEILIGEVGSLSGSEATFGVSTHEGIEMAIKEINAAGGVKGRKLKVKVYDDQGKPEEAATAATKLITLDKAVLLLGEVASTRSLAMTGVAQKHQVPMISPSSTNPKVTQGNDFVFRVCFIDPFQGLVMAKFARENLKLARVAVLRDVRNDYSIGLADVFVTEFKKLGGAIVRDESYSAGDKDFKAQLAAIKAANPEGVYVPGYYNDVGLIARQAKRVNIKAPLLGGDGWDSEKLYEIGGADIDGSFFSNHYSTQDPSPKIQKFVTDYKALYGKVPDGVAALGYDAAKIAADAMARAKSPAGPDLRDAIAATKGFDGVTGNITLDAGHNAVKPAVVLKVEGGKPEYQTTVTP